jgi:hypothetical protein
MYGKTKAAKEYFTAAARSVDTQKDPALYNLCKGMLQLEEELQRHLSALERKIVHVSQQIGPR